MLYHQYDIQITGEIPFALRFSSISLCLASTVFKHQSLVSVLDRWKNVLSHILNLSILSTKSCDEAMSLSCFLITMY